MQRTRSVLSRAVVAADGEVGFGDLLVMLSEWTS
jgi:hypothetical protein